MKLSILQENLNTALSIVSYAVASRSTLPVLSNVALETDGNAHLKLSAMDMEIVVRYTTDAIVEKPGGITVPARLFRELVGALPKGRLDLILNAKTQVLTLKSGKNEAKIKGIDIDEFPALAVAKPPAAVAIPASDLQRLINSVAFAASNDESRATLTGVYTVLSGQQVTMAATDGFRLALRVLYLEETAYAPAIPLIPKRGLFTLAAILDKLKLDDQSHVDVYAGQSQVIFSPPGFDLISQLIEANFPDYTKIIPSGHTSRASVDRQALARAIGAARLFTGDVKLTLSPDANTLHVNSEDGEDGDIAIDLDCEATGADLTVKLNASFALSALSAIDDPQVELRMTTPARPVVFKPANNDDQIIVIMPMSDK